MIAVFITVLFVSSAYSSDWESNGNGTDGKVLANLGSFLPPVSKISLPKLPAVPKRNTITLTTTVFAQTTKYIPIQATCLKPTNIQFICDGRLETRLPTDIKNLEIRPSLTQTIQTTATSDTSRMNIIDPIDLEPSYNYERFDTPSTPTIDSKHFKASGNFLEYLLGPKYEFTTKYLTVTKVVRYSDYQNTVTILAENCIPPNLQLPICDFLEVHYPGQTVNKKVGAEDVKNAMENTVQNVYNTLNKFFINNPFSFLGINPQHLEIGAKSKAESLIEKSAESFLLMRKIDDADN